MKKPLLCIGSINMDISLNVAQHPILGETVRGKDARLSPGGKGLNQAVASARLGLPVQFLGAVGQDTFGAQLLYQAKAESIDIVGIMKRPHVATGMALIVVDANGENTIVLSPGANATITVEDIEAHKEWIHDSLGVLLQNEIPIDVVERVMQVAHQYDIPIFYNPAPIVSGCERLFPYTSVVFVNETEAERLTGRQIMTRSDALDACGLLHEQSGQTIIITLGSQGAVCVDHFGKSFAASGISVKAVDTTSAGDTFVGAFLAQCLQGVKIGEALVYACIAGSLSVTKSGAQESIPTQDEVATFLTLHG